MSRAGFRPIHHARCTKPTDGKICGEVFEIAHGKASEEGLYNLRLVSRCPGCGGGEEHIKLLPRDRAGPVSRGHRMAIVGR